MNMGNKSVSKIVGIEDIIVQTNTNCKVILKDVRNISDLQLNLMSTNVLNKEEYEHHFGDGIWKSIQGSLLVARGRLYYTLYKTHVMVCNDQLNVVEDNASPNLWYKRLEHMRVTVFGKTSTYSSRER